MATNNDHKDLNNFSKNVFVGLRYPDTLKYTANNLHLKTWNKISVVDQNSIKDVNRLYGIDAKKLILMPNKSETIIGGHVFALNPTKNVHPSTVIDEDQPFGYMMLTRIHNDSKLSDAYFNETVHNNLNKAMTELYQGDENNTPSISNHFNPQQPEMDKAPWVAKLNGNDAKVGIYSLSESSGRKKYFVFAMSNAGKTIGTELHNKILKEEMTAGEYANDTSVIWAKNIGKRICARLLYKASKAIGVDIPSVEDINAYVPNKHITPRLALPHVVTTYNTYNMGTITQNDEPVISFYRDCSDGSQNKISTLIVGDPVSNIYEYQGKNVNYQEKSIENHLLNAVPCFTDKLTSLQTKQLKTNIVKSVSETINSRIKLINNKDPMDSHYAIRSPHNEEYMRQTSSIYNVGSHPKLVRKYTPVILSMNGQ